jgi:hypothetical protein
MGDRCRVCGGPLPPLHVGFADMCSRCMAVEAMARELAAYSRAKAGVWGRVVGAVERRVRGWRRG